MSPDELPLEIRKQLLGYMAAADNHATALDLPDGAWHAYIEDQAASFLCRYSVKLHGFKCDVPICGTDLFSWYIDQV